ncbi:hypothetical protein IHE45_20G001900 [Dioscorea alata]|uniref:Uncharacterized protein n=2 Tax=Dioscorea alata TaxID=55571 RepID=A0ACB7TPC6_DIOAL|nr:hypothetical protein IHE45_20G001900 [Dioscorea alata]KAH7650630.1 hypothetical protein IHE45_20G001900 [Dioscorea alata]
MAESSKGAPSTTGLQNKTSSLDDEFGEDFLTSWKSLKGKNSIDFDVETIPGNGKKCFNFDRLDALELGGGFDKISSFKMDMSDLDFSSLCKKDDKTKNPSKDSVNKEMKQDKFSFTFDFNELESFNLDSNLLKGEKKPRKCADSGDCSSKHDGAQDSRSYSAQSLEAFENKETKKSLTAKNLVTSPAEPAIKDDIMNGSGPSTSSDPGHQSMPHEVMASSEKQATIAEGSIGSYQDLLDGKYSAKYHADKSAQNISLKSLSGDTSENKTFPESGIGSIPLDCLITRKASKQDISIGSIDSSHSGSSSPANSYNSRGLLKPIITKSNTSVGIENQQENQDEPCGGSILGESNKSPKDKDISEMGAVLKSPHENKHAGGKQNTSSNFLPSSLNTLISNKLLKAKSTVAPQFSTLNEPAKNVSQPTSVGISKQLYSLANKKVEKKILCTLNGKRVQFHPPNMPSEITPSSNNKDKNHSSSFMPIKSPMTSSNEVRDICPKDEKRLTKLNITSANSTLQTETKSDKFYEENLQLSHGTESKVVSTVITRRSGLLSPPLKRKALEELKENTRISNQLKHFKGSTAERKKSLEFSAQSDEKLVPVTESPVGPHKEIASGGQNLSKNFEVPILIEDDGNVEKAEACAKELDDICTMLKKKHEEAKEILVRAVVNNNTLLMLNHPMFDEKIHELQKFAASLQSKEF